MPESPISPLVSPNQHVVYRLVKNQFSNTPLSCEGARRYGGRWNPPGTGILYTSASPELALLEQLVHLPALPYQDLPKLVLITLVLKSAPGKLEVLPTHWRNQAHFHENHKLIADWLKHPNIMALRVPSSIVSESYNYLLHPLHQDYLKIEIADIHPFDIDPRLWNIKNG